MSAQSNSPGSVISLPQGGGAMKGIGEKFSADLFTGTGRLTIPLTLPPGRNGFQPQLNLTYSSGQGNGPFGLGWRVDVPTISRKTSHGLPRYDDQRDVFLLSGAEDLVAVAQDSATVSRFRPRTETLFARIGRHHDASHDYWVVEGRDGLTSTYGTPSGVASDLAVVTDPERRDHVFLWSITQTTDSFGNRIEYVYERDSGQDGIRNWNQIYLQQVRYVDYDNGGATRFLVSVNFLYSERPDQFSDYRSGFEIRTRRRCRRIEIHTHAERDVLAKSFHFTYSDELPDADARSALNGVSLLAQVQAVGHDGGQAESLPPLELDYTAFAPEKRQFFPLTGQQLTANSLANANTELFDLNGDGLPDLLEMGQIVRYWRNLGGGQFDLPRSMPTAPYGVRLDDRGVQLIDANGDGRLDLLVTRKELNGYFPMRFDGYWDQRSFHRFSFAPSFDLTDPQVRLVDLTGDGVTDAVRSSVRFECFFNDPESGWRETREVVRQSPDAFPDVSFADPRVHWADMSGDGLQDIVLVHAGCVEYWPNRGYGRWGRRVTMHNSPRLPKNYDPARVLVGDVDGDGLADIVYVDYESVTLWINRAGNAWTDPITVEGTPPLRDLDSVRLADVLGSGVQGVLWSLDGTTPLRNRFYFLDFTGGIKPYLLAGVDNNLGAQIRVEYASSSRFYVEDSRTANTRWKTPLPFPVQVVARVETLDAISRGKLTTEYRYHHGYWDGAEREFRGFGRVDQRDTEEFSDYHADGAHPKQSFQAVDATLFSPPTETRTWFHVGPVGDEFGEWEELDCRDEFWTGDSPFLPRPPELESLLKSLPRRDRRDALRALRGKTLRTELYAVDGTPRQSLPYTVAEYQYSVREESPLDMKLSARRRVFFPHITSARTTQWERGRDPLTLFAFTEAYDKYGQPLRTMHIAVPRRRDYRVAASPSEPYLATATMMTYAQRDDAARYIVNRVAAETCYEILNNGSLDIPDLLQNVKSGSAAHRLIGQTRHFYDRDSTQPGNGAFFGLPFGKVGDYGALARTEVLQFTEAILHDGYRSGPTLHTPREEPPYLAVGGVAWTPDYPAEFRTLLPANAGYRFHPGGVEAVDARGYFVETERRKYDFHSSATGKGRGLLQTMRSALGNDTAILYDAFDLLPRQVTSPAGLKVTASYDYRLLVPAEVTDSNGNRTRHAYTPLGLLASVAVMGKVNENVGDTPVSPSIRYVYNFGAFAASNGKQPISVRTIRRVHHANDTGVPASEINDVIEGISHSDGFGRLIQNRQQAEDVLFGDPMLGGAVLPADPSVPPGDAVGVPLPPGSGPRVIVSGWQVYDNKGRVVEKFEPFFGAGWEYAPPGAAQLGQKATVFYDPRGLVLRRLYADGAEERNVYGVPGSIADPDVTNSDVFEPSPWETYHYDRNDNAGRSHPAESVSYQTHWNTPVSSLQDALGRTVAVTERKGPSPATDWLTNRFSYDVQGNLVGVTDATGRVAASRVYDLAGHALRSESPDAGVRRTVLDGAGNVIELRDSKGSLKLCTFDALNRPIRSWARDAAGEVLTLRVRNIYGDGADSGLTTAQAEARNLRGALYLQYDESGRLTIERQDFKGGVLEKVREVISDDMLLAPFQPPPPGWHMKVFRVDWQPPAGSTVQALAASLLDAREFRTSFAYDALSRIISMNYPLDAGGQRQELRAKFNRAGALESATLNGTPYVSYIAYNAKGQRSLIAYGNGIMTRHAFDPKTFRVVHTRTEPYTRPSPLAFHRAGAALQDMSYTYDLAGHQLALVDCTPGAGLPAQPDRLARAFSYDPLYRLLSASGRECDVPPSLPWEDAPRCFDITRARAYTETYVYDDIGNLTRLGHASAGGFVRTFDVAPNSNQLTAVHLGATTISYQYDANGNLVREATERHYEWDHSNRMCVYRTQPGTAEPSIHAQYLYDPGGRRVKKLVRHQGGLYEVCVYVDGVFEFHRRVSGASVWENSLLHVMDNRARIALARVGIPFPQDKSPAVTFHVPDHLGSSQVVVDGNGSFVNREETTPYGATSFGSFALKRYRFAGKERDEESKLYYFGARYYAPGLGRWISCDPLGLIDGPNLYVYAGNNPINATDPTGYQSVPDAGVDTPPALSPEDGPTDAGTGQPPSDAGTDGLKKDLKPGGVDPNEPYEYKANPNKIEETDQKVKGVVAGVVNTVVDKIGPKPGIQMAKEKVAHAVPFVGPKLADYLFNPLEKKIEPYYDRLKIQPPDTPAAAEGYVAGVFGVGFLEALVTGGIARAAVKMPAGASSVEASTEVAASEEAEALEVPAAAAPKAPAEPAIPEEGPLQVHRPMRPGENPIDYGNEMHEYGLPRYLQLRYPKAQYQLNPRVNAHGPDVDPISGINARFGEMKPILTDPTKLQHQVEFNWGYELPEGRYFFYDRQGYVYEGMMDAQ